MLSFPKSVIMPAFQSVAAGVTAVSHLPIGLSYRFLTLVYSGITLAQMEGIRVMGDALPLQNFVSGTELNEYNMYQGRNSGAAGVIFIDLFRYGVEDPTLRDMTMIGTGLSSRDTGQRELSTLTAEIDVALGVAAPKLALYASQAAPRTLGMVKHIRNFTQTASGAGLHQIADFPPGHAYNQVHFKSSKIDNLKVERNRFADFNRTKAMNTAIQNDTPFRVPAAGTFVFDPTEEGDGLNTLKTAGVQDMRWLLDMNGSDTFGVLIDSIAPVF